MIDSRASAAPVARPGHREAAGDARQSRKHGGAGPAGRVALTPGRGLDRIGFRGCELPKVFNQGGSSGTNPLIRSSRFGAV